MELAGFSSGTLAVFILTAIVGLCLAGVFRSTLARFLISAVVVIGVFAALARGSDAGMVRTTSHLQNYISGNPAGLIGFLVGFVGGLAAFRKN